MCILRGVRRVALTLLLAMSASGGTEAGIRGLPSLPGAVRFAHAAALDSRRQELLVYGGQSPLQGGSLVEMDELWVYRLADRTWRELGLDDSPGPLAGPAMVYDWRSDRVLLFGGSAGPCSDQLWALSRKDDTWTLLGAAGVVGARSRENTALVLNPIENEVWITFGNCGGLAAEFDYLRFDLDSLEFERFVLDATPIERAGHLGVWDSRRSKVVIYGGVAPAILVKFPGRGSQVSSEHDSLLRAVISYDPRTSTWNAMHDVEGDPSRRAWSSGGYDAYSGEMLVFGGEGAGVPRDPVNADLRRFDFIKASWTYESNDSNYARTKAAGVYCPCEGYLVVNGGLRERGDLQSATSETFAVEVEEPSRVIWEDGVDSSLVAHVSVDHALPSDVLEGALFELWNCEREVKLATDESVAQLRTGEWMAKFDLAGIESNLLARERLVVVGRLSGHHKKLLGRPAGSRSASTVWFSCTGTEMSAPGMRVIEGPNPTPFVEYVRVRIELESEGSVQMHVFEIGGRRVRTIDVGVLTAGEHDLEWDGLGRDGRRVQAGVYVLQVSGQAGCRSKKVVRLN